MEIHYSIFDIPFFVNQKRFFHAKRRRPLQPSPSQFVPGSIKVLPTRIRSFETHPIDYITRNKEIVTKSRRKPYFWVSTPKLRMPGTVSIYKIIPPPIASAGVYFFTTDSGMQYEVRFGRRQDNILHATIVFGVINEEFDGEEYVVTNKGEVFRVMTTIVEIVKMFMAEHTKIMCYEFTGIPKEGEDESRTSQRNVLYKRFLPRIFESGWDFNFNGNSAIVTRKQSRY